MEKNETVNVTEMQHRHVRTGIRDCLTVRRREGRERHAMRSADRAAADDESKKAWSALGASRGNAKCGDQHLERLTGSNDIASAGWRANSSYEPATNMAKPGGLSKPSAAEPCHKSREWCTVCGLGGWKERQRFTDTT